MNPKTLSQYDQIFKQCSDLFALKTQDYGPAWRVLRPSSITDQIFIKINRIRTLQQTKVQLVEDGIPEEFVAIVNYAMIGLIQLKQGFLDQESTESAEYIIAEYEAFAQATRALMVRKNHDYGEAWRSMRISSMTDLIFQKVLRVKSLEDQNGPAKVSEGIDANYFDMANYAIFCLILMGED
jgi:Nucleotide modification associated domain 1